MSPQAPSHLYSSLFLMFLRSLLVSTISGFTILVGTFGLHDVGKTWPTHIQYKHKNEPQPDMTDIFCLFLSVDVTEFLKQVYSSRIAAKAVKHMIQQTRVNLSPRLQMKQILAIVCMCEKDSVYL